MALTVVKPTEPPAEPPEVFEEAPRVVTTPCDPWPRPYFFEDGLRRVRPYHFTYNTYCKQRWRNREILDIFTCEFRDRPAEYYKEAIENGYVTINGKKTTVDALVRNGDVISHTLHRHEPPVSGQPITIVHEKDDMMIINKPAGIPVHPAGRYNYNSIVEIIRSERGYAFNPLPCHRLDRLTSGIMFIGKEPKAAQDLSYQIKGRTVRKEYVARVKGEFPEGEIICDQPILQISPKLGLNGVRANGKSARTIFKRLAYYPPKDPVGGSGTEHKDSASITPYGEQGDGEHWPGTEGDRLRAEKFSWAKKDGYSIVRCLPLTGRTHQLRVHLQFLGHPISNDPIYCNQRVFGPSLGRAASTGDDDETLIARLSRMGKDEVAEAVAYHDEMVDEYNKRKAEKMTGEVCEVCQTPLYSDPGAHELGIYLHAKRYACADGKWEYETPLPDWALPPLGMEGPRDTNKETDPLNLAEQVERLDLDEGLSGEQIASTLGVMREGASA